MTAVKPDRAASEMTPAKASYYARTRVLARIPDDADIQDTWPQLGSLQMEAEEAGARAAVAAQDAALREPVTPTADNSFAMGARPFETIAVALHDSAGPELRARITEGLAQDGAHVVIVENAAAMAAIPADSRLRERLETALAVSLAIAGDPADPDRWCAGYSEGARYVIEHVRAAMDAT